MVEEGHEVVEHGSVHPALRSRGDCFSLEVVWMGVFSQIAIFTFVAFQFFLL